MTNYLDIHFGDEVVIGPLKGVRFWTYEFHPGYNDFNIRLYRPMTITIKSFQYHNIDWRPGRVSQSEGIPTMENGRGLNVYKTEADAMRGSADAINDVIRGPDWWIKRSSGIVLGEVEFWGPTVVHEYGYHAQYVKPTRFLRAWGYQPEQTS
jgi:hypothetical protein